MKEYPSTEMPPLHVESTAINSRLQQGSAFLDVLVILARRTKFILWMTLAFAAVACAVSFILPQQYKATVVILPPQQQSSSLSSVLGQIGGLSSLADVAGSSLGLKNIEELYVAMLKSESVENAVIQRYGLLKQYHKKYYFDARKKLEWRTTIDGSKKDGLIRLTFEDRNPARAAEIANGYIEILRSLSQHLAITEAAQRRVTFEQQLEKAKNDLATSEEALKQTQISTGFVQIDTQARALIESAAAVRAQIVAKEVQLQVMQTYAGEGNPELQEQREELASLRRQFTRLVGANGSSPNDLFLSKGNVPQAALEYANKLRDVKYNQAVFQIVARQLEVAKIDEAKEGGFLQIVSPALTPERRWFPKRTWITIGAAAFGLSLAIVIALLRARVERMQANPIEAAQLAQFRQAVWPSAHSAPAAHSGGDPAGSAAQETRSSPGNGHNLHESAKQ
jgi:tyrosine-protein kinase Etk/Wzc